VACDSLSAGGVDRKNGDFFISTAIIGWDPEYSGGVQLYTNKEGQSKSRRRCGSYVYCLQSPENWEYFVRGSTEGVSEDTRFINFRDF